jgi:hypothetical protein
MEIYIQSAGIFQEQDYSWQNISNRPVDEPQLVKEFKHLLNTQFYSILLGRKKGELILIVTGMKASQRKDYRGRTLRNSIVFVAEETSQNDKIIRGLAVAALRNDLEHHIDNTIKPGGDYGFEVDREKIEVLIHQFDSNIPSSEDTKETFHKIGKNSEDNIEQIANELTKNSLPENIETLVVVTEAKNEDTLKNAKVWRGVSNLVRSETLTRYKIKKGGLLKWRMILSKLQRAINGFIHQFIP